MSSLSKGGGVVIGLTSVQLLLGLFIFIKGMQFNIIEDDSDDDGYSQSFFIMAISCGIISMLTSISGFCFGGKPSQGFLSLYLVMTVGCFFTTLVYFIWSLLTYYFPYYGFFILIICIAEFILSINVYKEENNGYQRFAQNDNRNQRFFVNQNNNYNPMQQQPQYQPPPPPQYFQGTYMPNQQQSDQQQLNQQQPNQQQLNQQQPNYLQAFNQRNSNLNGQQIANQVGGNTGSSTQPGV